MGAKRKVVDPDGVKSPVMLTKRCKRRLQTYGTKLDSWEAIVIRLMDVSDQMEKFVDLKCVKCGTPVLKEK